MKDRFGNPLFPECWVIWKSKSGGICYGQIDGEHAAITSDGWIPIKKGYNFSLKLWTDDPLLLTKKTELIMIIGPAEPPPRRKKW